MHYSIQQDLARDHHKDLLREATNAKLAAVARSREVEEPMTGRFDGLRVLMHRLHVPHVRPVAAH
jgi:hypothetical protein